MRVVLTPIFYFLFSICVINSTNAQQSDGGDNYSKIKLLSARLDSNKTVLVVKVDAPYPALQQRTRAASAKSIPAFIFDSQ